MDPLPAPSSAAARPRPGSARLWLAAAILLLWATGYTWATWRYFTRLVPGGNDFLAHYSVWEGFFKHGLNPYSDEAALYSQQAIYGRPARAGEDQNRLTYPFYSVVIHAPFILLDYPLARALYMTLLQAALFAGVGLMLTLLGWRPPPVVALALLAWSLLNYPEARDVILGQFALFGFFALAAALLLLARGRDAAAGALLVLATVKPTLVFLVVPFLLCWAATRGRWRFVFGFAALLLALAAFSWLALPSWLGDWLYRISAYSGYTVGQSPVWLLTHSALPVLGATGEWVISAGLLLWLLWAWWHAIRPGSEAAFHWTLGLTLVVSDLIVPRSATTNYVLLLTTTLWIFALLDQQGARGRWLILLFMAASVVGQWWLHFATVVGNQEQAVMFLPWPLLLGAVLWLGRGWLLCETRAAGLWPIERRPAA
ncbi:MAG: glycosyltransferase 87 family protein [Anaerolineales bacterium]